MQIFLCCSRSCLTSIRCILLVSHIKPINLFNLLSQRSRNKYCNNKELGYFLSPIASLTMSSFCSLGGFVEHKLGPRL